MTDSKKRPRCDSFDIHWGERPAADTIDKMVLLDEKFVYTIGNEIHFTANINKVSIQEIIKQMTTLIHNHKKKYIEKNKKIREEREERDNREDSSSDDNLEKDPTDSDSNCNNKPAKISKLNIIYTIDSPGGSVTSILKFVDFIGLAKKKYSFVNFTSIITGLAASAGTIMAIVADKRYMTKNAHSMIHELASGSSGKYTEMRSYINFLDHLHEKLVTIYCEKTKKSVEDIEKLLRNETWFSAEDYLKYGFIDEIK